MKISSFPKILSGACTIGLLALSPPVIAAEQSSWEFVTSQTSLFRVKAPKGSSEQYQNLYMDSERSVYSGELSGVSNSNAHYTVKIDQTLGVPIRDRELGNLIHQELTYHINSFKDKEGKVSDLNEALQFGNFGGGQVRIDYNDPELGSQAFKIRILYSDTSKIQQIAIGSAKAMDTYETRDFFDSFKLFNGYKPIEETDQPLPDPPGKIYTSPLEIFQQRLPDAPSVFMTELPKFEHGEKAEHMSVRFSDPVFDQSILYNVDGYAFDIPATYQNVMRLIKERYAAKHDATLNKKSCQSVMDGKTPLVECSYIIKPLKDYAYISRVRLRAQFSGNYVMVHEVLGSEYFINSPFINSLIQETEFLRENKAQ